MKIPISKIGRLQKDDVEKSSGIVFYDDVARICTVVKPSNAHDIRGDKSPYRMAELFGGNWQDYNNHFIIQAAGCPLKCPYCYVDNLKQDLLMGVDEIVEKFVIFKEKAELKLGIKLNVLHFMGGAPAAYCKFWPELRKSLDKNGLKEVILFSDVILVENHFYKVEPWKHIGIPNFILTGCLKGANRQNFIKNTGFDLYEQSLKELKNYLDHENFYLTLIGHDKKDLNKIYKIIPEERIDFLKIVYYEATKKRLAEIY